METGELWVDPADGMIMIYIGHDPDQYSHYVFYCPTAADNWCAYSTYDLKYLEKIK